MTIDQNPRGTLGPMPDFQSPPVVEVGMCIEFDPLERYVNAHAGAFWKQAEGLPGIVEVPLGRITRYSDEGDPVNPGPEFIIGNTEAAPRRAWLTSANECELVQIQHNFFARNWRRTTPEEYPRYAETKKGFLDRLKEFERFAEESGLGPIVPKACEMFYLNNSQVQEDAPREDDVCSLLTVWDDGALRFLPRPKVVNIGAVFEMTGADGTVFGHLTVEAKPAKRPDGERFTTLTLTARGEPDGEGADGVLKFFDAAHEWMVRGFADLTTAEVQNIWRRLKR